MMQPNPYESIKQLEAWLAEYTGATYAVTCHRCTTALTMVCEYLGVGQVTIPKRTYVEVPQAILRGGGSVNFEDRDWLGAYRLEPYPIWDSARRFTSGMYLSHPMKGEFVCLSFHRTKILGYTEGGAILTDSAEAAEWFKRARFGGRTAGLRPKDDDFRMVGWPCYMIPETASGLLQKAAILPLVNADLPNDDYPDLSRWDWNQIWKEQRK